jgi:elongation factor Ts
MDIIKTLREETGLSFAQIKKALDEANGDADKAREVLKQYSEVQAEKREGREMEAGAVAAYVHSTAMMGAMVVLSCETDFVAKNDEFKGLAYDLAMHVAAMGNDNLEEVLKESFIKDGSMTVEERLNGAVQKFGENVKLTKIVRFAI